jgi:hypothetical protein
MAQTMYARMNKKRKEKKNDVYLIASVKIVANIHV